MKNITIEQYKNAENVLEYDNLLKHLNPKNEFLGNSLDVNKITYKDVRSLVKLLKSGNDWDTIYDIFDICFDVSNGRFYEASIVEFYQARNFVFDYVVSTQKREASLLQSIGVDVELWKAAGGERLNKFSDLMPLVQLGELFSIYPFDLQKKPYNEILVLLVALKERGEVNQQFSKLKSKIK